MSPLHGTGRDIPDEYFDSTIGCKIGPRSSLAEAHVDTRVWCHPLEVSCRVPAGSRLAGPARSSCPTWRVRLHSTTASGGSTVHQPVTPAPGVRDHCPHNLQTPRKAALVVDGCPSQEEASSHTGQALKQPGVLMCGMERHRTDRASLPRSAALLTVNGTFRATARFCSARRCPRPWPPEGQMGFM